MLRVAGQAVPCLDVVSLAYSGGTNFADLLADPAEGDAGASPLFKWTSDGSMMEEVMKIYK